MPKRKHEEETAPKSKRKTKVDVQMEYMCRHLPLLELMRDLSPQQCETLTPYLKSTCHNAICCCIFNCMYNYSSFSPELKARCKESMKSKLDNYTFLSDKSLTTSPKNLKKREQILEQSGSGFPAILAAVLPLLSTLIAGK